MDWHVERNTLSDDSVAFNVTNYDAGGQITLAAIDELHATELAESLNRCAWWTIEPREAVC